MFQPELCIKQFAGHVTIVEAMLANKGFVILRGANCYRMACRFESLAQGHIGLYIAPRSKSNDKDIHSLI